MNDISYLGTTNLEERLAKAKEIIEEYNRLRYEEQSRFKGVTWKDRPRKKKRTNKPSKQQWHKEYAGTSFVIKGKTTIPDTRCIGTGFCSVLEDQELFAEDLDWYEDPEYLIHDGRRMDDTIHDDICGIVETLWNRL